jgi:hypothetical protein
VVEGKGHGAVALQGGCQGDQVGNGQGDEAKAGEGFTQGQKTHRSGARGDVAVTQGGEGDTSKVKGLDAARALGFLIHVEACGQMRPVKQRVPEDDQRHQRRDSHWREQAGRHG